jgi:hypothetical protein
MKNGKTRTSYMTLYGFLMVYLKSLYKKQKAKSDLRTQLDQRKKVERLASEYWAGTHTYKETEYHSKDYKHSSKLDVYFLKSKLKVKGLLGIWLNFMANLFGVLALACATLISGLSKLAGNVSPGIEPWAANVFTEQSAKGTFIRKNKELEKVLRKASINTKETWDKIMADGGSIQDLPLDDFGYVNRRLVVLSEQDDLEATGFDKVKDVFKTFKEINQLELVNQAGIRQQYVDQSVSLNLAFPSEATPKWINQVHLDAWKKGVKTLYYMRTESVLRGDIAASAMDSDCLSCDG